MTFVDPEKKLTVDLRLFAIVDPETAHDLLYKAHQLCPYSRATLGNIPVDLTLA